MISPTTHQNIVLSPDGTPIAFAQAGSGSPLILVHGTGADHTRWKAVLPLLAVRFTVICMDRRGRGESGDGAQYDVRRESEDIAAVAAAFDRPVDLLGHSFGAACALGAAPLIPNLRRLILYEPPMLHDQQSPERAGLLRRMDDSLAAGDREAVVLALLVDLLKVPLPMVERMRALPAWAGTVAAAHTIPRELRSSDAYGADPDAIQAITAPALFLLGSDSPPSFKATTETLHGWLPNSRIAILANQQHSAMLTAPDLFTAEVIRFLSE